MVSFDELEIFLGFFVFTDKGRPLVEKDFRTEGEKNKFPSKQIFNVLNSAFNLSQGFKEESVGKGQIYHVDFASMRIAGILRDEGLFVLITSASASLLDIEFKLRTLMTLFLGSFSHKFLRKTVRITKKELKDLQTFFHSKTGQKLLKKFPEINQRSIRLVEKIMAQNIAELEKMIIQEKKAK